MRSLMVVVGLLGLGGSWGCAHDEPRNDAPPPRQEAAAPTVTPEQNDAIDALFRRKAQQLQTCWQEEFQRNGNRKVEGDISLQMLISKSGQAREIKAVSSTIGVPAIDQCVVKEIATWSFPEGPADAPFRRTVHLGPAF